MIPLFSLIFAIYRNVTNVGTMFYTTTQVNGKLDWIVLRILRNSRLVNHLDPQSISQICSVSHRQVGQICNKQLIRRTVNQIPQHLRRMENQIHQHLRRLVNQIRQRIANPQSVPSRCLQITRRLRWLLIQRRRNKCGLMSYSSIRIKRITHHRHQRRR